MAAGPLLTAVTRAFLISPSSSKFIVPNLYRSPTWVYFEAVVATTPGLMTIVCVRVQYIVSSVSVEAIGSLRAALQVYSAVNLCSDGLA
jgi:hypothetical protein